MEAVACIAIQRTTGGADRWLCGRGQGEWDNEMERDFAPDGAGMALLEEMKADARESISSLA